jgi:hypothetical protein
MKRIFGTIIGVIAILVAAAGCVNHQTQQTPQSGPFDGSRQVNCRRLLCGLDVDGVSRFLLLAGVQCLHDDCVIVIVSQRDTGGVRAHWHDCNSEGCSGDTVDRKLSNKLTVLREFYDFAG